LAICNGEIVFVIDRKVDNSWGGCGRIESVSIMLPESVIRWKQLDSIEPNVAIEQMVLPLKVEISLFQPSKRNQDCCRFKAK
jgi:hypothetical protein